MQGRRDQVRSVTAGPQGFGLFVLRLWMWAVPVAILAASITFGAIAASDERWGLLAVMIVMAVTAIGLLVFHWWVMYRFGRRAAE